jgi:uncharacterized protein YggU (UPF0235/DUF167 family)
VAVICREAEGGISIAVKVMPKSRRPGLLGLAPDIEGDRLRIGVTAAPEGGRANVEACAALAAALGVAASAVSVAHGASSRQKLLRVTGDPALLLARVAIISKELQESTT